MKKYKVVLDTNVFINGWFNGEEDPVCDTITNLIDSRQFYLAFSQDTIGELIYVTKNYARHLIPNNRERVELLSKVGKMFLFGSSTNVSDMEDIPEVVDKTDLMFVHCALKSDADFLVTRDFKSGMFNVNNLSSFSVITPEEFLAVLDEELGQIGS